jgi:hypothetical protein
MLDDSLIGLPLSNVSTIAIFAAFFSRASAIFKSIMDLSCGLVSFHVSKAFHAALTASSISSFSASAHFDNTSPFAGHIELNVLPFLPSTHLH